MSSPLWSPDTTRIENAWISQFISMVNDAFPQANTSDYASLQRWSLANPEDFWGAVWQFCGVVASETGDTILADADRFPGARWFPDATLNFAENLLRYRDDRTALVSLLENGERREMSYAQLYLQVARLAAALRAEGVVAGDRVVGFMPNISETVVAMLAAVSIGATWSSCSPDFGINGVMDRFGQIQPKVMFCADGYFYNGKTCDSLARVASITEQIDSLQRVVVVPLTRSSPDLAGTG